MFINAEKLCLVLTPVNVLFVSCQQEREQVSKKDGKEVKKKIKTERKREKHTERLMEADYTASLPEASSDKGFVC